MDRVELGTLLCCGITLVPLVAGGFIGAWLQRRINTLGIPGAFLPAFIRKKLDNL